MNRARDMWNKPKGLTFVTELSVEEKAYSTEKFLKKWFENSPNLVKDIISLQNQGT